MSWRIKMSFLASQRRLLKSEKWESVFGTEDSSWLTSLDPQGPLWGGREYVQGDIHEGLIYQTNTLPFMGYAHFKGMENASGCPPPPHAHAHEYNIIGIQQASWSHGSEVRESWAKNNFSSTTFLDMPSGLDFFHDTSRLFLDILKTFPRRESQGDIDILMSEIIGRPLWKQTWTEPIMK